LGDVPRLQSRTGATNSPKASSKAAAGSGTVEALADFGELGSTELAEVSRVEPVAPESLPLFQNLSAASTGAGIYNTAINPSKRRVRPRRGTKRLAIETSVQHENVGVAVYERIPFSFADRRTTET
jgi:hypothetical protein